MESPRLPLVDISCSEVRLDPRANPLRESPVPRFARSPGFERDLDKAIVIADIFRDARGGRILLMVRPLGRFWDPLAELSIRCADTGRPLPATHFPDRTVQGPDWLAIDAPDTVSALDIVIGGQRIFRPVQPNLSRLYAGRRALVTMCRNEPIERIVDWAHWHADRHGFDGVLCYDNGSTVYERQEISAALASVPGIEVVAVLDWPSVAWLTIRALPWWSLEAWVQRAAIRHGALRFLQQAESMLHNDVDELLVSFDPDLGPVVDILLGDDAVDAVQFWSQHLVSPTGAPPGTRHRDLQDFSTRPLPDFKWLARPDRFGLERFPHQHDPDSPATVKADPARVRMAHFRPLTTGWGNRSRRINPTPSNPEFQAESRELRRQLDDVYGRWCWSAPAPAPPTLDDLCRDAWTLSDAGDHAAALASIEAALAEEPRQPALVAARHDLLARLTSREGS